MQVRLDASSNTLENAGCSGASERVRRACSEADLEADMEMKFSSLTGQMPSSSFKDSGEVMLSLRAGQADASRASLGVEEREGCECTKLEWWVVVAFVTGQTCMVLASTLGR